MSGLSVRERMECGENLAITLLCDQQGWLAYLCTSPTADPVATGAWNGPHSALNALLDGLPPLTPAEQEEYDRASEQA